MNPEPTDLNDLAAIARVTKSVRHRRALASAASEIERLRHELDGTRLAYRGASYDRDRMRAERDEVRLQTGRILNEIDCRIEHGAESNGHLEAIHNLFKEATDDR